MKKSLLILGFPRTMSSFYARKICLPSLIDFKAHSENSCEFLIERYGIQGGQNFIKDYVRKPSYFKRLEKLSDEKGWLLKDVNNPFICKDFILSKKGSFNVLLMDRNLIDVIYHVYKLGWFWPLNSLIGIDSDIEEVIDNIKSLRKKTGIGRDFKPLPYHRKTVLRKLVRAILYVDKHVYQELSLLKNTRTVSYEKLIRDEGYYREHLHSFGYKLKTNSYITPAFKKKRNNRLENRKCDLWKEIEEMVLYIKGTL